MPKKEKESTALDESQWIQIEANDIYNDNLKQLEYDQMLFKLLKNIKNNLLAYLNSRGEIINFNHETQTELSGGAITHQMLKTLIYSHGLKEANELDEGFHKDQYGFWIDENQAFKIESWFRDDKLTSERIAIALDMYRSIDQIYTSLKDIYLTEGLNHHELLEKLIENLISLLRKNTILHAKKEFASSHYPHISGSRLPGGTGTFFQSHLDNYIINAIAACEALQIKINPQQNELESEDISDIQELPLAPCSEQRDYYQKSPSFEPPVYQESSYTPSNPLPSAPPLDFYNTETSGYGPTYPPYSPYWQPQ
ncbi:MAG: hypothetical protein EP298_02890 [Gammaproteobacteria bacterium]|nr:MAG: hypothetical protein EP298_02890 [Gammaproteobacteria bacterium]UTW43370.1 hypothetical protein KFE69_04545 [bacterium SCSIO 12844]